MESKLLQFFLFRFSFVQYLYQINLIAESHLTEEDCRKEIAAADWQRYQQQYHQVDKIDLNQQLISPYQLPQDLAEVTRIQTHV